MRSGLACLVAAAFATSAGAQSPLFEVVLRRAEPPAIEITIAFPGEADGSTTVAVSDGWGGITGAAEEIRDLAASGPDGGRLVLTRPVPNSWSLQHEPGARLTLRYRLTPEEREPLGPGRNDYRNIVREGLFHAVGSQALVLPEGLEGRAACRLSWVGFEGWTAASSLGPGSDQRECAMTIDELRGAFLIAGEPGPCGSRRETSTAACSASPSSTRTGASPTSISSGPWSGWCAPNASSSATTPILGSSSRSPPTAGGPASTDSSSAAPD